jgi:hypothetical protein
MGQRLGPSGPGSNRPCPSNVRRYVERVQTFFEVSFKPRRERTIDEANELASRRNLEARPDPVRRALAAPTP